MTRRLAPTFALALLVLGCGLFPSLQVQLINGPPHATGCFAADVAGRLVVDPTYGTAIVDDGHESMIGARDVPMTVAWPPGFTGRRSGSEVEVLDPQGIVVATTGRSYRFLGGYVAAGGSSGIEWPDLKMQVIWACGHPEPLP